MLEWRQEEGEEEGEEEVKCKVFLGVGGNLLQSGLRQVVSYLA